MTNRASLQGYEDIEKSSYVDEKGTEDMKRAIPGV